MISRNSLRDASVTMTEIAYLETLKQIVMAKYGPYSLPIDNCGSKLECKSNTDVCSAKVLTGRLGQEAPDIAPS